MQPAQRPATEVITIDPIIVFEEPETASKQERAATVQPDPQGQSGPDLGKPVRPKVAIIIDDMGHHLQVGNQLLALEINLTFSFLPDAPFTEQQAERQSLVRDGKFWSICPWNPLARLGIQAKTPCTFGIRQISSARRRLGWPPSYRKQPVPTTTWDHDSLWMRQPCGSYSPPSWNIPSLSSILLLPAGRRGWRRPGNSECAVSATAYLSGQRAKHRNDLPANCRTGDPYTKKRRSHRRRSSEQGHPQSPDRMRGETAHGGRDCQRSSTRRLTAAKDQQPQTGRTTNPIRLQLPHERNATVALKQQNLGRGS